MIQPIQAPTDQQNTAQLASSIIYATWNVCRPSGGTNVEIEVRTAYIGEGAQIQIRLHGEQSGDLGGVDDTMFGNRYCADVPVPDSVHIDEKIWFTATLPQLGLSENSEKIPAVPPIRLVSMAWGRQDASRGDIVDIRAEFLGLRDIVPCEVHILEHDQQGNHDPINRIPSEIRNGRLNLQWEYQYHEETAEIPTENELQPYGTHYNHPEYFFVVEIDGQRFGDGQESGLLRFKDWIELKIPEELHRTSAGFSFQLADNSSTNSTPDTNGVIRMSDLPPGPVIMNISETPIAKTFFGDDF
jgi:hypothetical protein